MKKTYKLKMATKNLKGETWSGVGGGEYWKRIQQQHPICVTVFSIVDSEVKWVTSKHGSHIFRDVVVVLVE